MSNLHRASAPLMAAVVALACAACGSGSSSSAGALPTPSSTAASSSTRVATTSQAPPPPKVGQCRNPRHFAPGDWVDTSPVVPCSMPHTLETAAVIKPVEKLTLASAKQLAPSCESPVVDYLGITYPAVRAINDQIFSWPSRTQRAAGQNWLRCDVGVAVTTGCCHLAPLTGSLRGDVGSDPVRFQVCINQVPDPSREQPLTSCKKPHRAEALPDGLAWDVTRYPSPAALDKEARAECAKLVTHRGDRGRLVITSEWQSRDQWSAGTLYGNCWIYRSTGLLPAIR